MEEQPPTLERWRGFLAHSSVSLDHTPKDFVPHLEWSVVKVLIPLMQFFTIVGCEVILIPRFRTKWVN